MENTTHLRLGTALARASRRSGTPPSRPDQPFTAAAIRLNELHKRENVEQAFVDIRLDECHAVWQPSLRWRVVSAGTCRHRSGRDRLPASGSAESLRTHGCPWAHELRVAGEPQGRAAWRARAPQRTHRRAAPTGCATVRGRQARSWRRRASRQLRISPARACPERSVRAHRTRKCGPGQRRAASFRELGRLRSRRAPGLSRVRRLDESVVSDPD